MSAAQELLVDRIVARRVLGGIPDRTFARLEAEGILAPTERGKGGRPSRYDLAVLVPAYLKYVTAQRPGGDDRAARARKDLAMAELNELRIARERKQLLPRDQVVAEGQAFVKALQAKLRALPRRMASAGIVAVAHEGAVAGLVREALEEISQWGTIKELDTAGRERS